jgi:hypothetical protein
VNVAPTVSAGPDAEVLSGEAFAFAGTFSRPGRNRLPVERHDRREFGPDTSGSTNSQSAPIAASRQVCVAGS